MAEAKKKQQRWILTALTINIALKHQALFNSTYAIPSFREKTHTDRQENRVRVYLLLVLTNRLGFSNQHPILPETGDPRGLRNEGSTIEYFSASVTSEIAPFDLKFVS
jgi:hypothetical protein